MTKLTPTFALALLLAPVVHAGVTYVADCPAQGHFATLYAVSLWEAYGARGRCGYDAVPPLDSPTALVCACPARKTLAVCTVDLLVDPDGTAIDGVCEEVETTGQHRVTWRGRVR